MLAQETVYPYRIRKKRGRSQLFFTKGFLLVLQLFIALCFCLPCSPGFLLTLRTPKMATFMSPIFLPEHLVQHTVIDLLSFLLVFCKGQRIPQTCRNADPVNTKSKLARIRNGPIFQCFPPMRNFSWKDRSFSVRGQAKTIWHKRGSK